MAPKPSASSANINRLAKSFEQSASPWDHETSSVHTLRERKRRGMRAREQHARAPEGKWGDAALLQTRRPQGNSLSFTGLVQPTPPQSTNPSRSSLSSLMQHDTKHNTLICKEASTPKRKISCSVRQKDLHWQNNFSKRRNWKSQRTKLVKPICWSGCTIVFGLILRTQPHVCYLPGSRMGTTTSRGLSAAAASASCSTSLLPPLPPPPLVCPEACCKHKVSRCRVQQGT